MATSSRIPPEQNRPYQGYPFVNPVAIDVPTVDAATAAKWANLPRKPIGTPVQKLPVKPSINDRPSTHVTNKGSNSQNRPGTSRLPESTQKKEDIPVVYIELPEDNENGQTTSSNQDDRGRENSGFVQDTIFFDQFENRQIDVNKPKASPTDDPRSGASTPGASADFYPTQIVPDPITNRPDRPAPTLNLNSPGSVAGSSSATSPSIPGFMNKESQVYGGSGSTEDGFTLTPLPVADYPEPPPAYTEFPGTTNAPPGQPNQTPPRTVVVVPDSSPTVGLPSSNRKLVLCQNCSLRVHTVVMKENGAFTHFVALITVILCLLPLTVVIYCTDFFKYNMHFCPNCNHRIGYEIPILCQDMVFNGQ